MALLGPLTSLQVTRLRLLVFPQLLQAFARRTGVPVLLNTSFNVQEPIVCSPEEAIRCFQRTEVDWLVLGNLLVASQAGSRLL